MSIETNKVGEFSSYRRVVEHRCAISKSKEYTHKESYFCSASKRKPKTDENNMGGVAGVKGGNEKRAICNNLIVNVYPL